jgi:dihydroorotase
MTAQAWIIKGGHLVDPASGKDGPGDVLVAGGRIVHAGEVPERALKEYPDVQTLDATGLLVLPGLIDLRAHMGEPGRDSEETVAHGAEVALHGGFTTVACLPDTDPAIDNVAAALFIRRQSEQAGFADVHPVCAVTRGREGRELTEIGQLVEAGAVAFSDEQRGRDTPGAVLRGMQYVAMFDRAFIEGAQDPELAGGVMNAGYESMLAGVPGIPAVAEELAIARACMFARETGCHYHAPTLSTRNAVRAVKRARRMGVRVTAEVAAHHLMFEDTWVRREYDTNFKVFPPFRAADDRAWLIRGIREGVVDCIVSDHMPVPPQEKELEFGIAPFGAVGLETALSAAWTALVEPGHISPARLVSMLTVNPARVLRLDQKGTLAAGADADLCLFDPKLDWQVAADDFFSRARNSPFIGTRLTGRPRYTLVRGHLVEVFA